MERLKPSLLHIFNFFVIQIIPTTYYFHIDIIFSASALRQEKSVYFYWS